MRERYFFDRLFKGNLFVVFCVIFTIGLMIQTISSIMLDEELDLVSSVATFALFTGAPITALAIPRFLLQINYINEKSYNFLDSILMHYIISCILLIIFIFILRIFIYLPQTPHSDTLIFFTIGYIAVTVASMIICWIQTATANKNLKKINDFQNQKGLK